MSQADSAVAAGNEFVLTRVFDAPRERVFRAWTDPKALETWFGPKGCKTTAASFDLRPGGVFLHSMALPNGYVMWGRWVFEEIVPPERFVFVHSFSDEHGGTTRHPFQADWPERARSTVTFAEADGKTTITMRAVPLDATDVEVGVFRAGFAGMRAGWGGTLAQLDEYLASA